MMFVTLVVAALILLSAMGLVGLAWLSMDQAEDDLRAFTGPATRR
jgi:hypothetical protein